MMMIPPWRWPRIGLAAGYYAAAIAAFAVDVTLGWVTRWPRCGPGGTHE